MDSRLQAAANDFAKDSAKETGGTWAFYKSRQYLIARAHRNNPAFLKEIETQMRPFRRLIESGNMDGMKEKSVEVMQTVYATSVLKGIRDDEGDIPFTPADAIELFRTVPDLWDFVFKFAGQEDNYARDAESKN